MKKRGESAIFKKPAKSFLLEGLGDSEGSKEKIKLSAPLLKRGVAVVRGGRGMKSLCLWSPEGEWWGSREKYCFILAR